MMLGTNRKNHTSLGEFFDECASNRSSDLKLFTEYSSGDNQNLGYLLEHSLELLLIKENAVIKLFLDLDLGP